MEDEEWLISKEKTRKKRFLDATIKAGLYPDPKKPKPEPEKKEEHTGYRKYLGIKNLRE